MKRLAAIVVAVGLVAGAWYLRSNVIDDGGDDPGDPPPAGAPTLICATEVAAACDELDDVEVVSVEAPGTTYARLAGGGDLGADGWLVSQPWPGMLAAVDQPLAETSDVLGRTSLDVVTTKDRPAGLECTPITWECVAAFAGNDSGFAHAGVETTSGLLATHGIAVGLIGDPDYASNDFDEVEGFRASFAEIRGAIVDATSGRPGDLVRIIQTAPGTYSAVAALGTTAEIARQAFEAVSPTPEITADVVLAGRPDRFEIDDISDALFATGWLRSGDNALPGTNGLPNPGVMVALRELSR